MFVEMIGLLTFMIVNRRKFDVSCVFSIFFFQAEDGIRDLTVTGVQTCALPISSRWASARSMLSPPSIRCSPTAVRVSTGRPPASPGCTRIRVRSVVPPPTSTTSTRRQCASSAARRSPCSTSQSWKAARSEEHTSELQSQSNLVCRLLLEKKKKKRKIHNYTRLYNVVQGQETNCASA